MRKLLLLSLSFWAFTACSKSSLNDREPGADQPAVSEITEITLSEEEGARMVLLESSYTVSQEDLLRGAESLIDMIEQQEIKTKGSVSKKRVAVLEDSIVGVQELQTKSAAGEGQTAKVYVVSLGEGAGFGLFAGDKRGGGLIGYAEEGDFDPNDAPQGAEFLFGLLTDYVAGTVEQTEAMRGDSIYERLAERFRPGQIGKAMQTKGDDGLIDQGDGNPPPGEPTGPFIPPADFDSYDYREERVSQGFVSEFTLNVGPLLTTKWDQWGPYNNVVKQYYGNAPVGCVATAVAQIVNYHKHGSWNGHTYLWSNFRNQHYYHETDAGTTSLAQLFYDLGRPQYLNMSYSASKSSAYSDDVCRTLNPYYNHSGLVNADWNHIENSLQQNRPVYMSGQNGHGKGHAWVVDGVQHATTYERWKHYCYYKEVLVRVYYTNVYNSQYDFLHHNWGWNGQYNTWLKRGACTVNGNNYSHDSHQIIPNIRPK